MSNRNPKEIALAIAGLAADKKAEDIKVLEVGKVSFVADYFVICTGNSKVQVHVIADHLLEKMKEQNTPVLHKEGYGEGRWVLLDFGAVVVHIFQPEEREFYALERLWAKAPVVSLPTAVGGQGGFQ
ncbi:MAG: ribosome silencing factor [Dethiobacteria bacterium]|nr:ribosome silencing factor [Bacillota bacterium]